MLSYKRFKELKARLKLLTILTRYSKIQIRYSSRIKDFKTLSITLTNYRKQKQEINYIIEILRLHKILYKQHLTTLNESGNKC
jgi:hypothetical protein